jgi:steroid delta-isomerase-like uncharacterized protein
MASKNVDTFRAAHQSFNKRDFNGVTALMADNFVYHDHPRGMTLKGREGFRQFMQGWATAFSDAAVTSPTYIDGGNVVVAEFLGRGTNDGPMESHPATGKSINLPFCEIMRFDESGEIVSGAIYYDVMSMLAQLGLLAPAGSAR